MSFYQLVFFSFLLFVFSSCQKKSTMEIEKNRVVLSPSPFAVSDLSTLDWRVGNERKQIVSRGFNITIDIPQLTRADLVHLIEERQIDSWYIQLHRRGVTRTEVLYKTAVPLSKKTGQIKTALFPIQYAASAISMRMAESPCPTFSHRYLISGLSKERQNSGIQTLTSSALNEAYIGPGYVMAEIRPSSINGGGRLQGEYRVEIALFDTKTHRRKSNFVAMSDVIKISNEAIVDIKGCENFKLQDSPSKDMREFRFGR